MTRFVARLGTGSMVVSLQFDTLTHTRSFVARQLVRATGLPFPRSCWVRRPRLPNRRWLYARLYRGGILEQFTPVSAVTQAEGSQGDLAVGLLRKAQRLGLQLPLDLERLAITRGLDHYASDSDWAAPVLKEIPLSNVELAIALIAPSLPPTARSVRLAAALLGAPDIDTSAAAGLALQEGCAGILRYIAQSGLRFEPANPFWALLLARLPKAEPEIESMPHPTRFVEMTGINRGRVGLSIRWIRPRTPVAPGHCRRRVPDPARWDNRTATAGGSRSDEAD